jgi:3-oxoacyl-[acyl-carrier-protein] synthase III
LGQSPNDPGLAAIASHRPARVLENDELVARFGFEREFLEQKIGVRRRYLCGPDESVSDLAVAAAERVLASSRVEPGEVDLLVLCTQNPDYKLPTTADLVQHRLGLSTRCAAFDFNQGCSGYVYGLAIADSLMRAHGFRTGLLVTSEAYSKVVDPSNRDVVPLFGDGAAATLLRGGGRARIGRTSFGSDGSGANELIVRAGGSRHPELACAAGGALTMNGRAIFNFMMRQVPRSVAECLALNGLQRDQIDLFVFHQASRYMLEALRGALRLDPERVPIVMEDGGNTVSSTIPMALESLGGIDGLAGKRLLLCGFGVGLSWASTVLTIDAA